MEAELPWEPSVNAAEIGAAVQEGIVTLTGRASTYAEKYAAARAGTTRPLCHGHGGRRYLSHRRH